jgi:hypothetical protein
MWGNNKVPEVSVSNMHPTNNSFTTPPPASPKEPVRKEQKNYFNINVQAAPQQDTRAIVDEVMRRLKEQTRGALYDPVGVWP